jgi:hypothetical protein
MFLGKRDRHGRVFFLFFVVLGREEPECNGRREADLWKTVIYTHLLSASERVSIAHISASLTP